MTWATLQIDGSDLQRNKYKKTVTLRGRGGGGSFVIEYDVLHEVRSPSRGLGFRTRNRCTRTINRVMDHGVDREIPSQLVSDELTSVKTTEPKQRGQSNIVISDLITRCQMFYGSPYNPN